MSDYPNLHRLIETMATLRGEHGCEWDREQDHRSLTRFLIEESHELVDAIEQGDRDGLREELGDVLYQILFHADIAASDPVDPFTIDDVARLTDEKMRRRHPHVFAGVDVSGVEEIRANWQQLKAEEKSERSSVLDGIPSSLQGIARAREVIDKAARLGHSPSGEVSLPEGGEEELGGLLLALIAQASRAGLDADRALRGALRAWERDVREAEMRSRQAPHSDDAG